MKNKEGGRGRGGGGRKCRGRGEGIFHFNTGKFLQYFHRENVQLLSLYYTVYRAEIEIVFYSTFSTKRISKFTFGYSDNFEID